LRKSFQFSAIVIGKRKAEELLATLNEMRVDNDINRLYAEYDGRYEQWRYDGLTLDNGKDDDLQAALGRWGLVVHQYPDSIMINNYGADWISHTRAFAWLLANIGVYFGHGTAEWAYPEEFEERYIFQQGHGSYQIRMPRWEWQFNIDRDTFHKNYAEKIKP
jgi:hypothetical protein